MTDEPMDVPFPGGFLDPATVVRRYGLSRDSRAPSFDWIEEVMAWTEQHYPDAPVLHRAIFAAIVPGYTTGLHGGYGTEEHPLHQAAAAFVMALVGGLPPEPGSFIAFMPDRRLSPEETEHLLDLLETFLFLGPGVALGRALTEARDERAREALLRVRAHVKNHQLPHR